MSRVSRRRDEQADIFSRCSCFSLLRFEAFPRCPLLLVLPWQCRRLLVDLPRGFTFAAHQARARARCLLPRVRLSFVLAQLPPVLACRPRSSEEEGLRAKVSERQRQGKHCQLVCSAGTHVVAKTGKLASRSPATAAPLLGSWGGRENHRPMLMRSALLYGGLLLCSGGNSGVRATLKHSC